MVSSKTNRTTEAFWWGPLRRTQPFESLFFEGTPVWLVLMWCHHFCFLFLFFCRVLQKHHAHMSGQYYWSSTVYLPVSLGFRWQRTVQGSEGETQTGLLRLIWGGEMAALVSLGCEHKIREAYMNQQYNEVTSATQIPGWVSGTDRNRTVEQDLDDYFPTCQRIAHEQNGQVTPQSPTSESQSISTWTRIGSALAQISKSGLILLISVGHATWLSLTLSHQLTWKCKKALSKRKVVFLEGSVHFHVSWWEGIVTCGFRAHSPLQPDHS